MNITAFSPCLMAAAVAGFVALPSNTWAQPAPPMQVEPAKPAQFAVKGFQVTGDNPLGEAATASVLAPFVQPDASLETLQKAAAALEAALRDKGFGLHRVALPPQAVGDAVQLRVVHFSVASVTVEGATLHDEANIRNSLPELKVGSTPNFKWLAVQTAIANENQGKQIQVGVRESGEADKIDATVLVKENRLWSMTAGINNMGTQSTGRDRVTVAATHTNVLNLDHQLTAAYTTSLERSESVKQLGLSYRAPLYSLGGVLGANYTRADVVGSFGSFTSTGAGHTAGVNYTQYLVPQKGYRSYITLGLDDKAYDPTQLNGTPIVGQVLRRSRQISLGYAARHDRERALLTYNVDLAGNLASGDGNNLAAYQSEDPRITTTRWKALRANMSFMTSFLGNWQWGVRGALQVSPDALIAGEQFGLGGVNSVRGTMERPLSGDTGVFGSLEVTTPELVTGLRTLGFIDAGRLQNNNPNGANKPASDALTSAGLGLRYGSQKAAVALDYGRLLRGSTVAQTLNSSAPKKGDQKLHVSLTAKF